MKKIFLCMMIVASLLPSFKMYADPIDVPIILGYIDPANGNHGGHKQPIRCPELAIDGHTLYFYYGCDNTTLNLVDEDDEIVYTTEIDEGTTMLVLPEWLEGTFEIQIVSGSYTFVGEIEL